MTVFAVETCDWCEIPTLLIMHVIILIHGANLSVDQCQWTVAVHDQYFEELRYPDMTEKFGYIFSCCRIGAIGSTASSVQRSAL